MLEVGDRVIVKREFPEFATGFILRVGAVGKIVDIYGGEPSAVIVVDFNIAPGIDFRFRLDGKQQLNLRYEKPQEGAMSRYAILESN
jgi:hypothetical protein